MPLGTFPVPVHVGWPVAQEMVPARHGLPPGLHGAFAVHVAHTPSSHTSLVPHAVPFGASALGVHVGRPLTHDVVPFTQGLPPGWQAAPATHGPQLPSSQTSLVPHAVPFAALPVCVQVGAPLPHAITPSRQASSFGWHPALMVHALHCPPPQTSLVPHGVPFVTLLSAVQTDEPVVHELVPIWHGLPGAVHVAPAVQATQLPARQTMFVPQDVPSGAFVPRSAQPTPPSTHVAIPRWHGWFGGSQGAPLLQGAHVPSSQYLSTPQAIPLGWLPAGMHVGVPVAHAMAIFWQEPASVQSVPAAHATHDPLLHTAPASHAEPLGLVPEGEHTVAPASQRVTPR
jgi:hypothetical protein